MHKVQQRPSGPTQDRLGRVQLPPVVLDERLEPSPVRGVHGADAASHLVQVLRRVDRGIRPVLITDDQAAGGLELEDVLAELLTALKGRVLIAHHAVIECGFLGNACRRLWGTGLPVRVADTQVLARRTLERRQIAFKSSDLRL